MIRNIIKPNCYHDSIFLMEITNDLKQIDGIDEVSVVMGTDYNKNILKQKELLTQEGERANPSDLLISIKTNNTDCIEQVLLKLEEKLNQTSEYKHTNNIEIPKSIKGALKLLPDTNWVLISIPGEYAKYEAINALNEGLNVMIFSDNVSLEDEIEIKTFAQNRNLLVMGPDCGTSIINGIGLGFANKVKKGNIGIVGASGTGIQEISCIISRYGGGISHAIGTGGRDIKKEVGGISLLQGLKMLNQDTNTEVIVIVSKPPDNQVVNKILDYIKTIKKPVVINFLGMNIEEKNTENIYYTKTLQDTAVKALSLIGIKTDNLVIPSDILKKIEKLKLKNGKYIRGLFSGGTLCTEALLILSELLKEDIYSNIKFKTVNKLTNSRISQKHTIIDLGDDEFTVGTPHPMIDFNLRNEFILKEAKDNETKVILFDLVLGYGANPNPASSILPAIRQAKYINENIIFVASICGTEEDFQDFKKQEELLAYNDVILLPTNALASEVAYKLVTS